MPSNTLGESMISLLDRKVGILEKFVADAVSFMDRKGLLDEFVKERLARHTGLQNL